jgi:CheY-like chemotaxis protein
MPMTKHSTLETILLVDLDALRRSVVATYLRECGYRVIEATDEDEALTAVTAEDADVLVTDMMLAAKSGFQLSSEAQAIKPALKVILTRSAERTAKVADELCEDGPLDHPYHRSISRSGSNGCASVEPADLFPVAPVLCRRSRHCTHLGVPLSIFRRPRPELLQRPGLRRPARQVPPSFTDCPSELRPILSSCASAKPDRPCDFG